MSFEASATHYGNKEPELFGQSITDPSNDFFQYLDFDSVETAEGSNFAVNSDFTHVVSTTGGSNSAGTSSLVDVEARKIDLLLQPWLGESTEKQLTESFEDQLPAENSLYSEESGRAAISDSELLSLEGISLSSPKLPSLPSSPTQSATKSARRRDRILSSVSKTFKRSRGSQDTLRAPVQKSNESPKMMSSSKYSNDWEQRMVLDAQKFDFGFPQQGMPLSPPPSRVSDASSNGAATVFKMEPQDNDFYAPHQFPNGINNYTPLTTPIVPENLQASSDSQYPSTPLQSPWEPVSNTGGFSDFREPPAFVSENEASPAWWNHATSTEVVHPSPSVYHNDGRNANKTLAMRLQNDLPYNNGNLNGNSSHLPTGLMIQGMPESENQQSYVIEASPRTQQGFFAPPHHNNPFNENNHHRSSRHRRHHNRTPSPCNSPSPKSHPSSHHSHSRSWSHSQKSPRTKGSRDNFHSSATKRGSRTPSRKSSSNNISAQRSSQSLQSPVVDFVNFTPSDSMRILTGVAPSGSSKTKARREKEANDKRRRLSMAAVRAVRAAGGDVESLVEEGLFV